MSKKLQDELSFATNKKHTIKFKIVFIGDQNVGKSSIINRFIKNQFDLSHHPTVGIDFVSKNIVVNDKSVRLQLWDTAGQERFRSLIPGYLRDSNSVFLIYDVTNAQSFNNTLSWIDYIKENRGDDVVTYIIGNKIDAGQERKVTTEEAKQKFKTVGASFFQVSAKTGQNLEQLFNSACLEMMNLPDLETTVNMQHLKFHKNITGEQQRPKIKQEKKKEESPVLSKQSIEIRGSKLIKNKSSKNGRIVREKNCC